MLFAKVILKMGKGNSKNGKITKFQPNSVQPLQVHVTTDTCASKDENQVSKNLHWGQEIITIRIQSILGYPSITNRQKKD